MIFDLISHKLLEFGNDFQISIRLKWCFVKCKNVIVFQCGLCLNRRRQKWRKNCVIKNHKIAYFVLMLAFTLLSINTVYADDLNEYNIKASENGGSFLMVENTFVISGGEVIVSGNSTVPIIISGDSKLILDSANIESKNGAAITIESGVNAEIELNGHNSVSSAGNAAGINVGYTNDANMASLTISGTGSLTVKGGPMGGAGIGGNGTNDAKAFNGNITIKGGTIKATALASSAGIGGGTGAGENNQNFKSGKIKIEGGKITATGNDGGAGIGGGKNTDAAVEITGGNFVDIRGGNYAAGIGGGNNNDAIDIKISGGTFKSIRGYDSNQEEKLGGAAIGAGINDKNVSNLVMKIEITGGEIESAVAGWGAAGIGRGANSDANDSIRVGAGVQIERIYTDGTKMPLENGTVVDGNVLQVAFSDLIDTNEEKQFEVMNYNNPEEKYSIEMPDGYHAFATVSSKAATYSVRGSQYYAQKSTPGTDIPSDASKNIELKASSGVIAKHDYLYPVDTKPSFDNNMGAITPETLDEAGVWGCLIIVMIALACYAVSLGVLAKAELKN